MAVILVTGVAGFIGSHVASELIKRGDVVLGVDNMNDYYDVKLKKDRLKHFFGAYKKDKFEFFKVDVSNYNAMEKIFKKHKIDKICHLAAQAGVRYSIENPFAYTKSNVDGTLVMFELARRFGIKTVIYASSSSVYGGNEKVPFSVTDSVDRPISIYAATKRMDELMAHTYHHLFKINMTGLRFFTVYGPYGRPDMAAYLFADSMVKGKNINVFNNGEMKRDFTYITDIVDGVISALDKGYQYEIFNLGNSNTVELNYFIEVIEKELNVKAKKNLMPLQQGDVPMTFADIEKSKEMLGFSPKVKVEEGIHNFVEWYKVYHNIKSGEKKTGFSYFKFKKDDKEVKYENV
jgi:UDP-glucuronate 4-epimerase